MNVIKLISISVPVFLVSVILTDVIRRYALKKNIMDIPGARSSHSIATPRGGGLAIVLSFYTGVLLYLSMFQYDAELWLLFSALPVILVGVFDDHGHVSAAIRFLVHLLSSALVIYILFFMDYPDGGKVSPISIVVGLVILFSMVWLINLYNFMDGIDGIASIEAMVVALGIISILVYRKYTGNFPVSVTDSEVNQIISLLTILSVAVSGFLIWNWPPAKIFMGDAGSGFLGMIIAIIALLAITNNVTGIWSWLILLGVFIVDASLTLARRVLRQDKWYAAHCSHAYQHAARKLSSHQKLDWLIIGFTLVWLMPLAFLSDIYHEQGWIYLIVAYLPIVLATYRLGAGIPEPRQDKISG